MPPSNFPFLYHTATIRQAVRLATRTRPLAAASRSVHSKDKPGQGSYYRDNTVPFDWEHSKLPPPSPLDSQKRSSTLTPTETQAFKGIFDEIAEGNLSKSRKRKATATSKKAGSKDESAQEHSKEEEGKSASAQNKIDTRSDEFRQDLLGSLPDSLRSTAEIALGVHTVPSDTPGQVQVLSVDEADQVDWDLRAKHLKARASECQRIEALLTVCRTDVALWHALERHVFTLPERLEICNIKKPQKLTVLYNKETLASDRPSPSERSLGSLPIEVYGPLYPYMLERSLVLFETAFGPPSPLAFYLMPQIKAFGPSSYLLGVTKPFLLRLARMHWEQFGDAHAALDVLEEFNTACIDVDDDFLQLLVEIEDDIHLCTKGEQNDVVRAVVKTGMYQKVVNERVRPMREWTMRCIEEANRKAGYLKL
ncbi:hypothetical protein CDD81_1600 [Ophiocordyceps australis]|uniref:Mtf2-like C-terminal domain-containing protein n=1 Tax=Ophiocordyceps australis TaxID=1399860 RepID=A0A2C5XZF0_9HYPO|nr:hypothetical protein CDD81_1600 [Ophiocordyceps australis]